MKSQEVEGRLKCQYCESEAVLPFKCPFCRGYFCAEHRLPEEHRCPEVWRAFQIRDEQKANVKDMLHSQDQYDNFRVPRPRSKTRFFEVSGTELRHLTVGTLTVFVVGFSIFFQRSRLSGYGLCILLGSALIFTLTFILHEIAHKVVAQRYGLWAEFRLTLLGALLTLLSVVSPLKIVSPGVVEMAGVADKKIIGKVSLAGPATNMILSFFFLLLSYCLSDQLIFQLVLVGAILNPWTALFNLIPFSVFDGQKILWWNKKVWAASFVASLILAYSAFSHFFAVEWI